MNSLRRRKNEGLKNRLVFVMLLTYIMPSTSQAVTMEKLKGNSGFRAIVIAIANMNIAMQQATLNPQDKTRRQNVAIAYSMMPLAITALAKEFKSNKLHDGDFQFVQGILGGFVQKDLHSKVEEFMKNPSRQNIPQVGANFPQEALKQSEETYIVANREKSLLNTSNEDGSPKQTTSQGPSDLADLSSRSIGQNAKSSSDFKSKPAENSTIVANKSKSLLNSSEEGEGSSSGSQKFKEEISQEVLRTEGIVGSESVKASDRNPASTVKSLAPASSQEDGLDKEFFKDKKKSSTKEDDKKSRKPRRGNRLKTSQSFSAQRTHLVSYLFKALTTKAAAAPAAAPAAENVSGCKDRGCGGDRGGGGGGAADILFGFAAMIAAAAPMVAAKTQADADEKINQTNAATAITNANTQAQLQKYTVDQQTGLARFQAEATEKIAAEKNKKEMDQLQIQLAEIKNAREQQASLVREERQLAQSNLEREIALQQELAQQKIQLAQQQRLSDEVAQGLSTNLQNVRDPAQRLAVSRIPISGGIARQSTAVANAGSNLNRLAGSSGINGPQLGGATATNPIGQALKSTPNLGASLQSITSSRALKNNLNLKSAQTLLVSAQAGDVGTQSKNFNTQAALSPRGLKERGIAKLALGSTRALKQRINSVKDNTLELYNN